MIINNFLFKKIIKPYLLEIIVILILTSLTMIFPIVSPLLTKSLIDNVFIARNTDLFLNIIIFMIVLYVFSSVTVFFSSYITEKIEFKIYQKLSEKAFNSIQHTSIEQTRNIKIGDYLNRIMENIETASSIPTKIIPSFVVNLIGIIVPLIIMISLNTVLALIIISPTFLFILSAFIFGEKIETKQMILFKKNADIFSFLKEHLSILPMIKVFGLRKWSNNKFDENLHDYYDKTMQYNKFFSLSMFFDSLIMGVPIVLLIFFGGYMVINNTITLGTFTVFMAYSFSFFSPISQLNQFWVSYKSSIGAVERVNEIIESEKEKKGKKMLKIVNNEITIENIDFFYNEKKYIFKKFNAKFKKGLNYIVGENGSGKSTLLKLVCGLYEPTTGKIKIDGVDITNVKKKELIKNIAVIFSEPYLFDGTIFENIKIGKLSSSRKEVENAAKSAEIHNFIKKLPKKYETEIGENGLSLSSGEQQKIALARALLKNSKIILLDEATRSVDSNSRKLINETIKSFKKTKIIIIVTHNYKDIEKDSNLINIV